MFLEQFISFLESFLYFVIFKFFGDGGTGCVRIVSEGCVCIYFVLCFCGWCVH